MFVFCCFCVVVYVFNFSLFVWKASIWLVIFVVFASVSFVLLCTDDFFFTKIYSSVHARWSIAQFRLLHSFVFNYKSVAVCKINVHDYRTGKNSWVWTIHVTLSISCLRYKTALSRDFSLVFLYKNTFLCCAARELLLFSLPKNVGKNVARSRYIYLAQPPVYFVLTRVVHRRQKRFLQEFFMFHCLLVV